MLHAGLDLSRSRLDVGLLSGHGELSRVAVPCDLPLAGTVLSPRSGEHAPEAHLRRPSRGATARGAARQGHRPLRAPSRGAGVVDTLARIATPIAAEIHSRAEYTSGPVDP
jgi:hypothetical protein